eukprot:COSAG04_NODE_5_length_50521_cov_24.772639_53_plen_325_part_00
MSGDDAHDGSASAPFRTVHRAAAAVRALPRPLASGGVTVHLQPGDYELNSTLALGLADSGTSSAARVDWVAEGGRARLLGGKVVPHALVLGDLPAGTRAIDLKAEGVHDFGRLTARGGCCNAPGSSGCPVSGPLELFLDSRPLHVARWPNLLPEAAAGNSTRLQWATTAFAGPGDPGTSNTSFRFQSEAPFASWSDWSDVWAHGLWWYDWNDLLSPVAGIDRTTRSIQLAPPYPPSHSADGADPVGGITGGARYWLQNSKDALDAPGEYWLNKTSGLLYFLPFLPPAPQAEQDALRSPVVEAEAVVSCAHPTSSSLHLCSALLI